eukprot:3291883-Karenia_brevis.AAC.1
MKSTQLFALWQGSGRRLQRLTLHLMTDISLTMTCVQGSCCPFGVECNRPSNALGLCLTRRAR